MSAYPAGPPNASNAVAALVLGILGIILCPLLGPVAWVLGRKGEQEVARSGGAVGGRCLATAGKIVGMVGTFFLLILFAVAVAYVVDAPALS